MVGVSFGSGLLAVLAMLVGMRRSHWPGRDLWMPLSALFAAACLLTGLAAAGRL